MSATKKFSVQNNKAAFVSVAFVSAAVVLAAGKSSRFGSAKQLAKVGDKTLLELSLKALLGSAASYKALILGAHAEEIKAQTKDGDLGKVSSPTVIQNDNWQSGMSSSIKAAVDFAREKEATHLLLMVCDQPQVNSDLLNQMLTAASEKPDSIVACTYGDTVGVPAIFPAKYYDQLYALSGDRGAKAIIQSCPELIYIDFPAGNIDIDTPQDLASREFI